MTEEVVELRRMTKARFEQFIQRSKEDYAKQIARNTRTPLDAVMAETDKQLGHLLKDGLNSEGHCLFDITKKATGENVGSIWFHVDRDKGRAFLYDIIVNEPHRGKGYGRKALDLLEAELREMNIHMLRLHVFADNEIAMNLYKTNGFYTTSINMQKEISSNPANRAR